MKPALLLLLIAGPFEDPPARSRTVPAGDERIEIVLPVSSAEKSATAVVTLPEEGVDSIVVSRNEEDLSLERHRGNLFLKLLRASEGDIHVLGASGTLYRFFLRPARPGEAYDARVRVERPAAAPRKRTPAVDLIRAMRLGRALPDASVRSSPRPLLRSDGIEVVLHHVYDTALHVGFVVELRNLAREEYRVDPSRFSCKGLVLIGSRDMAVPPGASTTLYLVFAK